MRTLVVLLLASPISALDNGFPRPAMGFNPWNCFGVGRNGRFKFNVSWAHRFNDSVMRSVADAMVSTGLAAAGYEYVSLDCGWTTGYRDHATGEQIVNASRFPHGMKALGDYIHGKGLKYGIYTSASLQQCCSKIYSDSTDGSLDHEAVDAAAYASFGVDYLKFDGCDPVQRSYPAMRDALNATGRPILLSVNGYDMAEVDRVGEFANSWRTTGDDDDSLLGSLAPRIFANDVYAHLARPGQFNDPDMLEVGNLAVLGNVTDARAHFSLWCAAKAPLIIGTDVTNMSAAALAILTNDEAIAVNQDPLGLQAFVVWRSEAHLPPVGATLPPVPLESVWAGPLEGGAFAVVLFNAGEAAATITLTRAMLLNSTRHADVEADADADAEVDGGARARSPAWLLSRQKSYEMRDIWARRSLGAFSDSYAATVEPHDVLFLRLSPVASEPSARSSVESARR